MVFTVLLFPYLVASILVREELKTSSLLSLPLGLLNTIMNA